MIPKRGKGRPKKEVTRDITKRLTPFETRLIDSLRAGLFDNILAIIKNKME